MKKLLKKLKERWKVKYLYQVVLILVIFSITGMAALYVRRFAFGLLGFDSQTPLWAQILAWLLIVVPSYQVLFLLIGFLFGQFEFVWRFEKKNVRRVKNLFSKSSSD